jgi:hypothetical protein
MSEELSNAIIFPDSDSDFEQEVDTGREHIAEELKKAIISDADRHRRSRSRSRSKQSLSLFREKMSIDLFPGGGTPGGS